MAVGRQCRLLADVGAGGIVDPPGGGALMQAIGPLGLPAVIVGLDALLVGVALYRSASREVPDRVWLEQAVFAGEGVTAVQPNR
ncbi:hypothetical protein [Mesorhizobium sp. M4A.F.Ca.ET.090.04.2.1]|uniref:hypothetical protein n=2 Tax=Mesorhizobium TaxID=68287 RepID=UPI001FDF61CF|nr:hypothetical protein [Mesorhizobium sp. M4A.F.Ca.ET.090.04.2.1]